MTDRGVGRGSGADRGAVIRGSGMPARRMGARGREDRSLPSRIFMHNQRAEIDTRLADDSDKVAVASFNSAAGGASDCHATPLRPDFGTVGRVIKLRTNFFPVHIQQRSPSLNLYGYHVSIYPVSGTAVRHVKRRIFQLAEQTTEWAQAGLVGRVVHNNSDRLFSATLLPQPLTIRVPYTHEDASGPPHRGERVYTLEIVFTDEIDTVRLTSYLTGQKRHHNDNIFPIVSVLSVALNYLLGKESILVGQNRYFSPPAAILGGAEVWKGICVSIRPTYKQLMINVDACMAAFHVPGNLAHVMTAFQDMSLGRRMNISFCGVRIRTTHLGIQRTIKKFTSLTARTYSFEVPEYGQVTMEDFFMRRYNIRLEYPNLQLVEVIGQMTAYLPAELCYVLPGQPWRGKFSGELDVKLSHAAQKPPSEQGETTANQLRQKFRLDMIRPELESFGITIGSDMSVVPGRVLPSPGITYASNTTASVGDRAFWNLVGSKFVVGAHLDNWVVLVIKDGMSGENFTGPLDRDLHEVVHAFCDMCSASGMHVATEPTISVAQLPRREPHNLLRREGISIIEDALLNVRTKPTFILVMLANRDQAIYEGVKHLCDVSLDVATVCVQSSKVRKCRPHYLANVVQKVNMKLGGINHRLDANDRKWLIGARTMVVGMYVMHPSPGSVMGCPSIAAVVASVDNDFVQYPVTLGIQESRKELITDLRSMIVDRLKLFQRKNDGNLPERILIYRGGVLVNKINALLETELPAILEAFRAVVGTGTVYRPKTTIVAYSKSRRVRFYPAQQDDASRDGNPLPGTVVDRGITNTYNFDFFLQSHGNNIPGNTHPTHYHVVYDENQLNADDIQGVTHALSYVFGRATQAVSVACPVYYAREACQRGRCYLRKLFLGYVESDEGMTPSKIAMRNSEEAQRSWGWGVSGHSLKDSMFYL